MAVSDIVFTRDVQDVVWTPSGTSSSVIVTYRGTTILDVVVYPDSTGKCRLAVADLLRSTIQDLTVAYEDALGIYPLSLSIDGTVREYLALQGTGSGQVATFFESRPMFVGPQISTTFKWAKELLCYLATGDDLTYTVQAYCSDGNTVEEELTISKTDPVLSSAYVAVADISPERVAENLDIPLSSILAYDVFRDSSVVKRFKVSSDDVLSAREFFFRNPFGVMQSIFSRGEITEGVDFEEETFVKGHIEKELNNKSRESFSVNSGYISDNASRCQWAAFLRSAERYVYSPEGILRRIIIDETDADMKHLALGELNFTFHYADSEVLYDSAQEYSSIEEYFQYFLRSSDGLDLLDSDGLNLTTNSL